MAHSTYLMYNWQWSERITDRTLKSEIFFFASYIMHQNNDSFSPQNCYDQSHLLWGFFGFFVLFFFPAAFEPFLFQQLLWHLQVDIISGSRASEKTKCSI